MTTDQSSHPSLPTHTQSPSPYNTPQTPNTHHSANEVLAFEGFWVHSPGASTPPLLEAGSTRHMTLIFNAFVFCQIFNE